MLQLDYTRYKKPLIMTPHPDDLEGFAGGLAYLLPPTLVSVVFAGGNLGVWSRKYKQMAHDDYIRVRLAESQQAANILGIQEIVYMGYPDRTVTCDPASIALALDQLRLHQPDMVVSFEFRRGWTPYPHPDHAAMANIVRHAIARYERRDQLDYYLCATLLPNRFVNVTQVRRKKLEALACHTTQQDLNTIIFPFFEKLLSRLWGVYTGADYAEGYRQVDIPDMIRRLKRQQARL